MTVHGLDAPSPARSRLQTARDWRPTPAAWTIAGTVAFLLVTVWWLANDSRVPSFDPAAHIFRSLQYADAFRAGDLTEWFTSYQTPGYPPLVYVLGAFTSLTLGDSVPKFVLVENLVFVPLLTLGAYQTGKLAYNARAGMWAALFLLGTPLIIAQAHVFMLDMPQTAMVAMTAWGLVASQRFARTGVSFWAGVALGLGMLSKNIFLFAFAGFVVVMLLRGGWRHPKGIAAFVLGAIVCGGVPWYVAHFGGLLDYALAGSVAGVGSEYGADPPRWGLHDWSWYLWAALNVQLYLPLFLFGLTGVGWGLVRIVRRRPWAAEEVTPEIVAALLVGMVLSVALTHNDLRYTMPLLVFVALLGTAWFATAAQRWLRVGAGTALAIVCVLNVFTVSTGDGPNVAFHVNAATDAANGAPQAGDVHLFSTDGFVVAGPSRSSDVLAQLRAARRQGARQIAIDRLNVGPSEYNAAGVTVLAHFAGLDVAPNNDYAALGPRDLYVTGGESSAPPCQRVVTGEGVYFELGADVAPVSSADTLVCPTRSPDTYAAPDRPQPDAAAQAELLRQLRAARAQGIRHAYFQDTVIGSQQLGSAGDLQRIARRAGLTPPPGGLEANLGADGVTVVTMQLATKYLPEPCFALPNGDQVVLFKGRVTQSLGYATNVYCPARSPEVYSGPSA
jgi:4-amino-4-deoxy-L-arabinose transferase-like glycosyltransferase